MAIAFAVIGLAWCGAFVFLALRAGTAVRVFVDRWLSIYERVKAPAAGTNEAVEFPDDIKAEIARLLRKESRESESSAFREAYFANDRDWAKVRVAMGMTP